MRTEQYASQMPPPRTANASRRGRPPASERPLRRAAALDAARAELVESGYDAMTMQQVAQRAGSSKESLYKWFGSKQGLVAELIAEQSTSTNAAVKAALENDEDSRTTLTLIATNLLELLVSPVSLALNRAAVTAPDVAADLLKLGRHTTGPLIETYLAKLHREGVLEVEHPAEAFRLLYGLVVQDTQIRALLGESPPSQAARNRQATTAVDRFWSLCSRGGFSRRTPGGATAQR
jgi:AcrR family transcriptional regulator